MKVLIVSPGTDMAGIGYALKAAFDRHAPKWQVRTVRREFAWFDYPADIHWPRGDRVAEGTVRRLWRRADVVHLMETFGDEFGWRTDKPRVIHHHGFAFTRDPLPIIARARAEGLPLLVSTLDMTKPDPDGVTWLPNPCDTESLGALRRAQHIPGPRVRIVHSPSSRGPKATETFLAAIEPLRDRIDLELIEGQPWAECLRRKAAGDVLFDQLLIGYALTSIEAWGLGLAVVSGASDPWVTERIRSTVGFLPYLDATAETLGDRLAEIVDDERLRADYAEKGRETIAEFHDEREVVRRLIRIYEQALDTQRAAA